MFAAQPTPEPLATGVWVDWVLQLAEVWLTCRGAGRQQYTLAPRPAWGQSGWGEEEVGTERGGKGVGT